MKQKFMEFRDLVHYKFNQGLTLKMKLMLYLLSLVCGLLILLIIILYLVGTFSSIASNTQLTLSSNLIQFSDNITASYDELAGRCVNLSERLTSVIENQLLESDGAIKSLNNERNEIEKLELNCYDTLTWAIESANCSGGFIIFNCTVNTFIDNSEDYKSGIYLRIMDVNSTRPIAPDYMLYRGSSSLVNQEDIFMHSHWKPEFNISEFPINTTDSISQELYKCYCCTEVFTLPDSTERVMLIYVPILASNGETYGYCGFEISSTYFSLMYSSFNTFEEDILLLISPIQNNTIYSNHGFMTFSANGEYNELLSDPISIESKSSLYKFTSVENEFIGMFDIIPLAPLGSDWAASVMLPYDLYLHEANTYQLKIFSLITLFAAIAILFTIIISVKYINPVLRGLDIIRNGDSKKTSIREINDLIEYLAQQDAIINQQKNIDSEESIDEATLTAFIDNVKSLTRAERSVYRMYLDGKRAPEIAELLCVSINTVKSHSKSIYRKLNINSRKELLKYAKAMKRLEMDDSPPA